MFGQRRAIRAQPCSFGGRHRFATQGRLRSQPREIQVLLDLPQTLYCIGALRMVFGKLSGDCNEKAETVLQVSELRVSEKPIPIELWISHEHPRQSLRDTSIEVILRKRRQDDNGRIQLMARADMGVSRIAESRQLGRELFAAGTALW